MDQQDPMEDFQFKPLTEGLGFHKKAEKIKADILGANLGRETAARSIPEPPPKSFFNDDAMEASPMQKQAAKPAARTSTPVNNLPQFTITESPNEPTATNYRTATQSISELMASLPPSLDFLDEKPDLARAPTPIAPMSHASTPTMASQMSATPAARTIEPQTSRPQIFQPLKSTAAPAAGPTIGSVLPPPGTKAGTTMSTAPAAAVIQAPVIGTQKISPYREQMNETFARSFPQTEVTKTTETEVQTDLVASPVSLSAAFIDALMVAGLSTILLVCILTITKINLIGLLTNARTDGPTQFNLFLLFLAVLQMYMLTSRALFGATLGEWAFDQQMGDDKSQRRLMYPVQVLWRSLVNTFTGIIVLPLLSFAFRKDVAKYLTGLQLYRRP